MTDPIKLDEDARFFAEHPTREVHIRKARPGEQQAEFLTLGFHLPERRRIIVWKVPKGSAYGAGRLIPIPFLQFADETIEDTDEYLRPILHKIMTDAAKEYGIQMPRMGRNGH